MSEKLLIWIDFWKKKAQEFQEKEAIPPTLMQILESFKEKKSIMLQESKLYHYANALTIWNGSAKAFFSQSLHILI